MMLATIDAARPRVSVDRTEKNRGGRQFLCEPDVCPKCGGTRIRKDYPSRPKWVCEPCCRSAFREWTMNSHRKPASPRPLGVEAQNPAGVVRSKRWRCANPEKRRAHKLVEVAVMNGTIVRKPCERCGSLEAQAHHEDYTAPLEIIWLCSRHHRQRHIELRNGKNSDRILQCR